MDNIDLLVDLPTLRSSLIFETDSSSSFTNGYIDHSVQLLKDLEDTTYPNIKTEAPSNFRKLIESLRSLNEAALDTLLKRVENLPTEKILLNALPLVNTEASLTIMTKLYMNGGLNSDLSQSWLNSVTFIKHPTSEMISALMVPK